MFRNLQDALKENGYSLRFVAEILGISQKTVRNKISEVTDFTFPEYLKLCNLLNRYSPNWLFQSTEETDKAS